MGIDIQQTDSGKMFFRNDLDQHIDCVIGGPATPSVANPRSLADNTYLMPLAATVDTGGGVLAWQNPFNYTLIVNAITLDVTTIATGTCDLEAGVGVANATTVSTNMIATQDIHSATGTFNSGFKSVKIASGQWVTVSTKAGTSTGLVGNAYINFTSA
jgi:hypothetical protein